MLRALQGGRLNVAPQEMEEDEDGNRTLTGETPFPNHRGFRQELSYEAGEEFDIREKVPADFADMSPQQAGQVRKRVEQLLAEQNPHFEYVDADEADLEAEENADPEEED